MFQVSKVAFLEIAVNVMIVRLNYCFMHEIAGCKQGKFFENEMLCICEINGSERWISQCQRF